MATLIKIGNSLGIKIPKSIVQKTQLEDNNIAFEIVKNGLLIKQVDKQTKKNSRADWEEHNKKVLAKNKGKEYKGVMVDFLNADLVKKDDWKWE